MTESYTSQDTEPLPLEYLDYEPFDERTSSKLGELVVTDPKDPFVWKVNEKLHPSKRVMGLLWFMYRMSGHFPTDENKAGSDRDKDIMDGRILDQLNLNEVDILLKYVSFLATEPEA